MQGLLFGALPRGITHCLTRIHLYYGIEAALDVCLWRVSALKSVWFFSKKRLKKPTICAIVEEQKNKRKASGRGSCRDSVRFRVYCLTVYSGIRESR